MATNIGTQAAELLERVQNFSWILKDLGHIGTCINGNAYDAQSFYNIVEFMTKMNADVVDEMKCYLEERVVPIVSHINTPEAK